MTELTAEYLENHRHAVHTPESWARAIAERILNAAIEAAGTGVPSVEIPATFRVKAYEPLGCVQFCTIIYGVEVCYHLNT